MGNERCVEAKIRLKVVKEIPLNVKSEYLEKYQIHVAVT